MKRYNFFETLCIKNVTVRIKYSKTRFAILQYGAKTRVNRGFLSEQEYFSREL